MSLNELLDQLSNQRMNEFVDGSMNLTMPKAVARIKTKALSQPFVPVPLVCPTFDNSRGHLVPVAGHYGFRMFLILHDSFEWFRSDFQFVLDAS